MIRCGNPAHTDPAVQYAELTDIEHHHRTVAQVRLCFHREGQPLESVEEIAYRTEAEAESAAESAAERANERFWEEGPDGGYYAGSAEEARDNGYALPY